MNVPDTIREIEMTFSPTDDRIERQKDTSSVSSLRKVKSRLSGHLRRSSDVDDLIKNLIPVLQDFLQADGFAFQYRSNLHVGGQTPPLPFIRSLIDWTLKTKGGSEQYHTTALHREWPNGSEHKKTACGVLIQPILVQQVCQLIWFRAPAGPKWVGRLKKDTSQFGKRALGPRPAIDIWVQEHRDESAPWPLDGQDSANEVFPEFLDILAALLLLKEENAALRQFAASAVHDIKAPLRGISMALEMMDEANFDEAVVRTSHAIAHNSAKRLTDLSSGLLDAAVLPDQKATFTSTNLDGLAKDACGLLGSQIEEVNATVTVCLPITIQANSRLLLRLFLNLIGNALKYRDPDNQLSIDLAVYSETSKYVEIAVTDTGIGIAPEYADQIFKPLQRLHSCDEIEGSGLGLTICTRIADAHNGTLRLDQTYTGGARFIVRLPKAID